MPDRETLKRVREDKREGKAPSTQAGEFIREEFHHIREGKHGARSTKQAIAIGLSKARRAGVRLAPPKKGRASERVDSKRRTISKGALVRRPDVREPRLKLCNAKGTARPRPGRFPGRPRARLATGVQPIAARKAARTRAAEGHNL